MLRREEWEKCLPRGAEKGQYLHISKQSSGEDLLFKHMKKRLINLQKEFTQGLVV